MYTILRQLQYVHNIAVYTPNSTMFSSSPESDSDKQRKTTLLNSLVLLPIMTQLASTHTHRHPLKVQLERSLYMTVYLQSLRSCIACKDPMSMEVQVPSFIVYEKVG